MPPGTTAVHSGEPSDLTLGLRTPKSNGGPANLFVDEDGGAILRRAAPSKRFVTFVLRKPFVATPLILLVIFIPFITVAWSTALQDTRLVDLQAPANRGVGVSLR